MIVWRDGEFKGIDTPDVKIGDCVPVCMNLPDPPIIHKYVDLEQYFSKKEHIYGTELHRAVDMVKEEKIINAKWWDEHNDKSFVIPYPNKNALRRTMNECADKVNSMKKDVSMNTEPQKYAYISQISLN